MKYKDAIKKIKNFQNIDTVTVDSFYQLSTISLAILLLLIVGTVFYFYPVLSSSIVVWGALAALLILYRLFDAYQYIDQPQKRTIQQWYVRFLILALATALLFGIFAFFFVPQMDTSSQLFAMIVLLGLVSGGIVAHLSDFRLALMYMSFILLPLVTGLILDEKTNFHAALIIATILFYFVQLGLIVKHSHHELKLKEMQKKEPFFRNIFQEAPIGIFSYDKDLKIVDFNRKFCELCGNDADMIVGMEMKNLPDTRPVHIFKDCFTKGPQTYTGPYLSLNRKYFWVEATAFPYRNDKNKIIGGVGIIEDKTREHNALHELEYLVEHDVLTDLLNRRGFANFMNMLISKPNHEQYYSVLFYLDLNQFKTINDSLGHMIGDKVLLAVSKRLLYRLPSEFTVCRMGGDEFILILPYVSRDRDEIEREAKKFSKVLEGIFHDSFAIDDMLLYVKASIGIIIIEPGYRNIDEIIRHADITMYHAKKSNNHISFYNASFDKNQKELFALQHDLAQAIQNQKLELFLQPIVRIADDTVCCAELLLRWEHPDRGLLLPDTFITLAEEAGLLSKITWWTIDVLCSYISEWKKSGIWNIEYISININAQQLIENDFATKFLKKLKAYRLDAKDIMIEITECSLVDNFENTQTVISHLRAEGVRCAIDDFGIGYSSLSYLKRLSFDILKIDKEFVKNIDTNLHEHTLMKTILDIGRQFDYNIVIEGIETQKQKEILKEIDSGLSYQGFLFDRPLQINAFVEKYLKG